MIERNDYLFTISQLAKTNTQTLEAPHSEVFLFSLIKTRKFFSFLQMKFAQAPTDSCFTQNS